VIAVARAMEGLKYDGKTLGGVHQGQMRAADHQFIQPLYVSVMKRAGTPGTRHDNEGSGYGFRTVRFVDAARAEQAHQCKMQRPSAAR
jgi:branched-chain amino acid transport system substrate-binding protein